MNCVLDLIENQDLFAVPVTFSFRKKGSEQKTLIGGSLSILIRLSLVAYIVLLTSRMLKWDDNFNATFDVKKDSFEKVNFGDTKVKVIMTLLNASATSYTDSKIPYDQKMARFF